MQTTCPLDCFDACSLIYEDKKLKGDKLHPITKGFACGHINKWFSHQRLQQASLNGVHVSIDEAIDSLVNALKNVDPKKVLYYQGSGNLGLLQNVCKVFFTKFGANIATGSLCDGAGEAGVNLGRGASLSLSPLHVSQSDVVFVWGRQINVTNIHMQKALVGKIVIEINPVKTQQNADFHLQILPRSDIYLAILFSLRTYKLGLYDRQFIQNRTSFFDEFLKLICSFDENELLQKCGLNNIDQIDEIIKLIYEKKVCILVGVGVQRYSFGHQVLQMIDSFGALFGLFGKVGCGVGYLGDSKFGFKNSFDLKAKYETSVVNVDFSKYDVVFIQGSNLAVQMPNNQKVIKSLKKCKFVTYFGLHVNQSAKLANLVIPACSFLAKDDVRVSYGHEYIGFMPKILDENFAISEYELTKKLCEKFNFSSLLSQKSYIDEFVNSNSVKKGNYFINKIYENLPYENGFYTQDKKFHFCTKFEDNFFAKEKYFLITQKHKHSLNSQFYTDEYLHVNINNLKDNDEVIIKNSQFSHKFKIKINKNLRSDCVLLHSGHSKANAFTSPDKSKMGESAIYGEVKVDLEYKI